MLKLILDIFFFFLLLYFCYHYVLVLRQLRKDVIFPITEEELAGIRKQPEKVLKAPNFQAQKVGIIMYGCALVFVIVVYIAGIYYHMTEFTVYFMMILVFTYSTFALNVFAITESGIVSGARFVSWNQIKSYQFIPIDLHHKLYGYSKVVNNGYELKVTGRGMVVNCLITNEMVKYTLECILKEKVKNHLKE